MHNPRHLTLSPHHLHGAPIKVEEGLERLDHTGEGAVQEPVPGVLERLRTVCRTFLRENRSAAAVLLLLQPQAESTRRLSHFSKRRATGK